VLQYQWGNQRIQPSSPDLCRQWAEVMVGAQAAGRRIESADAWIAATALLHVSPLVTHNRNDYLGVTGLTLISHTT
jgi:predicted nucleic acid-binding protein